MWSGVAAYLGSLEWDKPANDDDDDKKKKKKKDKKEKKDKKAKKEQVVEEEEEFGFFDRSEKRGTFYVQDNSHMNLVAMESYMDMSE